MCIYSEIRIRVFRRVGSVTVCTVGLDQDPNIFWTPRSKRSKIPPQNKFSHGTYIRWQLRNRYAVNSVIWYDKGICLDREQSQFWHIFEIIPVCIRAQHVPSYLINRSFQFRICAYMRTTINLCNMTLSAHAPTSYLYKNVLSKSSRTDCPWELSSCKGRKYEIGKQTNRLPHINGRMLIFSEVGS